jgi:hypothetical protein
MSEELFIKIADLTYGFSILPFTIAIYLFIRKRVFKIASALAAVLFITCTSNTILFKSGFGHIQEQFLLYDIFESICWLILIIKIIRFKLLKILPFLYLIFVSIVFLSDIKIDLEIISKVIQFILGILLLKQTLNNDKFEVNNYNLYLSIGLLTYSFMIINLSIFKNVIFEMNKSSFSTTWFVYQFSTIAYSCLLSISIWKSQKI